MPEKKIKLLIVDDEVKFLEAIARRLQMRGFDVHTAADGPTALEIARDERFDLALLDLKMPGMSGDQVLEALRREHRYLEVVILTGHGSMDSAVECTKRGAFGYLPKPYELDRLIDVLKEAYEHRMRVKWSHDQERLEQLMEIAVGDSPLGILRRMRQIDDDSK